MGPRRRESTLLAPKGEGTTWRKLWKHRLPNRRSICARSFDPNKLIGQFQTMLTQYKLPGVDIGKLIAAQQRNLEAVAEANRVVEGIQALAKRQVEVVQETMKGSLGGGEFLEEGQLTRRACREGRNMARARVTASLK
jgi:hypothetical protein